VQIWLTQPRPCPPCPRLQLIGAATELASGLLFAGGLVLSGMVRPTKVVAFLSALHPAW
jgi:hypothetical protein